MVLNLDASNAQSGTGPFPNGCSNSAGIFSPWFNLASSAASGTLTGFGTGTGCGTSSGWIGDGTYKSPYAISLDGVDDIVTIPHESAQDAFPITITSWFNFNTSDTARRGIITKYIAASSNGYNLFTADGKICAWYFISTGNSLYNNTSNECGSGVAGYNDGNWHHVAFVADTASGRTYVDGALGSTMTWNGTSGATTTTTPIVLGAYIANYFAGKIANAKIYSRALTPSEISQNYAAEKVQFISTETTATGSLVFSVDAAAADGTSAHPNGCADTTWNDLSGNGYNATLFGYGTCPSSTGWTGTTAGYYQPYALKLNGPGTGIDQYAQLPANATLNAVQNSNYTLETWFMPSGTPLNTDTNNFYSGILVKSGYHLGLHYNQNNRILTSHLVGGSSNCTAGYEIVSSHTFDPGSFYHAVSTVNVTTGTISLYVNGALEGTGSFTPGAATCTYYGATPWRLGISLPGSINYKFPINGQIGLAKIYTRALSSAEVQQNYNAQKSRFTNSPVTSGLVFHLDAAKAASSAIPYSVGCASTNLSWNNLISGNTASTLTNFGTTIPCGGNRSGWVGNGTPSNPYALQFDGGDDLVTLGTLNPDYSNGISIDLWANTVDNDSNGRILGMNVTSATTNQILFKRNGTTNQFTFYNNSATTNIPIGSITNGAWQHYAVTVMPTPTPGATSGVGTLYVNGVAADTFSGGYIPATVSRGCNYLGNNCGLPFNTPPNKIGMLRVYNRSLSSAEVAQNYSSEQGRFVVPENIVTSGLVLHVDPIKAYKSLGPYNSGCDSTDTSWPDLSGYGNTLTLTGFPMPTATFTPTCSASTTAIPYATPLTGWRGMGTPAFPYSLAMDWINGSRNYVAIGSHSITSYLQNSDFTIEAWYKPNATPDSNNSNHIMIGRGGTGGGHEGLRYGNGTVGDKHFALQHTLDDSTFLVHGGSHTFNPGVFYHLVGVVSVTGFNETLYVNGVQESTASWSSSRTSYPFTTSNPWYLGINTVTNGSSNGQSYGQFGPVRMYNRALSSTEVTQNFNAQKARFFPTVVNDDSLLVHLDPEYASGTAAYSNGCADLTWTNLVSGAANGTLMNFSGSGCIGPTYASGWTGSAPSALTFDGTDDYVDIQDPDLGNPGTDDFSVEIFVKTTNTSDREIVSKRLDSIHALWDIRKESTGAPSIYLRGTSGDTVAVTGSANIASGAWRQYTLTRSGTSIKTYVDGTQDINTTSAVVLNITNSADIRIGSNIIYTYWSGSVGAFRYYSRALTQAEIMQNCKARQSVYGDLSCRP